MDDHGRLHPLTWLAACILYLLTIAYGLVLSPLVRWRDG